MIWYHTSGADGDPDTLDNLAMRPSLEGNAGTRCHADDSLAPNGGGSAAGVVQGQVDRIWKGPAVLFPNQTK